MKFTALVVFVIHLSGNAVEGFTPQDFIGRSRRGTVVQRLTDDENKEPTPAQQQDMLMEELSRIGAKKIAQLSIPERTKRAMLAEAIEDRIFDYTTKLEDMLDDQGRLAGKDKEKAAELAKQAKMLQVQYNDLVSGNKSDVLQSLESLDEKE